MMDDFRGNQFRQCNYIHEIETANMRLQIKILESHLETKDKLLRNLEDIIDEQENRIEHMEQFIQGRASSWIPRSQTLKGISVLSLDFGALSEENLQLKEKLAAIEKERRITEIEPDEDYESDFTGSGVPLGDDDHVTCHSNDDLGRHRQSIDNIRWSTQHLRKEQSELQKMTVEMQRTFHTHLEEVKKLLTSKTHFYFANIVQRYKTEMERRKELHNELIQLKGNIRVYFRIRPVEDKNLNEPILHVDPLDSGVLHLDQPSGRKTSGCADVVIPPEYSQEQVFDLVSPLITSCLDGQNVCIFAYGHTGSGKTYTMEGPDQHPGLYHRTVQQLFLSVNDDLELSCSLSILEIYNDKIRDLLDTSESVLQIRTIDGEVSIPGLTEYKVDSPAAARQLLTKGIKNKAVAATDANSRSSRSHLVVRIHVKTCNKVTGIESTGRINLVDLAGSERVANTNATGQLLKEAQCINRSLSELGNVVFALRRNLKHIPFRNSQLTRFLEDSLDGDSKTLVLVHLSPHHLAESVNSINFAEKIGKVTTKARTPRSK